MAPGRRLHSLAEIHRRQATRARRAREERLHALIRKNNEHPHPPLDHTRSQIRLLSFQRDGSFEMTVHDMNSLRRPHYYALSYCWTTAKPSQIIMINGYRVAIRRKSVLCTHRYRAVRATPQVHQVHVLDRCPVHQTRRHQRTQSSSYSHGEDIQSRSITLRLAR